MSKYFKTGIETFANLEKYKNKNIKDVLVKDIDGVEKKLEKYFSNKKAVVIVNTASSCGLTSNTYRQMVDLYNKYEKNGLEILGFPCNQFKNQESMCELDIKKFAKDKFNVTFPMFSKIEVNGPNTHELYLILKSQSDYFNKGDGKLLDIPWNFTKFLVNSEGKLIRHYEPTDEIEKIVPELNKLI